MPNDPRTGINDFYDPSAGRNPYIGEKVLYDTGQGIQAIPWTGSAAPGQGTQLSYQQALNAFSKAQGNPQMFNSSASDYAQLQNKTGAFDPTISSNYLKFNPTASDLSIGSYTPQAAQSYVAPPAGIQKTNNNLIGMPGYQAPPQVSAPKPIQVTLRNGQVVSMNPNGTFTDQNGNPIASAQITASNAGTAPITPSSLAPTSPINYSSSTYNPLSATSALNGAQSMAGLEQTLNSAPLGPQDQKLSDISQRLMDLYNQEAGKSGYQNEQNTAAGVDTNQATVNSLTAQRQQILAAHTVAQLQTQQGEGVTTAIDSRQRAEETRQNAIQVLSINTLLDAANGDLANAQLKANKAVAMKYDPIEAQITAAKNNLDLLKNDPATTQEEKARADAQSVILDQMKAAIAQAKTESTKANDIATTAATYIKDFVPTAQYPTATQALQAMQNSDSVTAQMIAEQTGMVDPVSKGLPASAQEYEYAKSQGYKGTYTQYQNEDANRKLSIARAGTSVTNNVSSGTTVGKSTLGTIPSGVSQTSALAGQAIIDGNQPPIITNSLSGQGFQVKAYLEANGYDVTKAVQDWTAITKWQNTVNSATFQRAIVASDSATQYIQTLRGLSAQWSSSGFPTLNYVNFNAALQGLEGQKQQALAQQIKTQLADLTADMSSVYRYGLSGTDETLKQAAQTLSTNWGNKQLNASLDIIDNNLKVRINSLRSPGNALSAGGGTNPYVGGTGATNNPLGI